MSYSLNSFMPWEGYIVSFNGTRGRLEHKCQETVYISGDGSVPGALRPEGTTINIYPHFKPAYAVEIWKATGATAAAIALMLTDIFDPAPEPDKYLRAADQRAGAYSILTGVAANRSMATGQLVMIDDLVKGHRTARLSADAFAARPSPAAIGTTPIGRCLLMWTDIGHDTHGMKPPPGAIRKARPLAPAPQGRSGHPGRATAA